MFKAIKDRFGHGIGDQALQWATRQIGSNLRPEDYLGRYGGDEFMAILPGASKASAHQIARRMSQTIRAAATGHSIYPTVSIGVATAPEDSDRLAELIEIADKALYHVKASRDSALSAYRGWLSTDLDLKRHGA